jgi:hypothetical protein
MLNQTTFVVTRYLTENKAGGWEGKWGNKTVLDYESERSNHSRTQSPSYARSTEYDEGLWQNPNRIP